MEQGRALAVLVADILNKMIEKDPTILGELVDARIPAPKALTEYPNVLTFKNSEGIDQVSILGLLAGFFDGWAVAYYPKELHEEGFLGDFRVIPRKRKK